MKRIQKRLLFPLLALAILSVIIARLFDPTLDYSSLFLNLTTELVMVVITIYYVDVVVRENENEKWAGVDQTIISRIGSQFMELIMRLCEPFDVYSLTEEIYPKLFNPRGAAQTVVYLYFIKKMEQRSTKDFEDKFKALPTATRSEIYKHYRDTGKILREILGLYGNRLPPQLLFEILQTEGLFHMFNNRTEEDGYEIYLLLRDIAHLVETMGYERLEYHMKVDDL